VLLAGDGVAVARARRLFRAVGMVPWRQERLDRVRYHAAAGLTANGTAALAAAGTRLLVSAGAPRRMAARILGPLLRSVAENVTKLGLPEALTGPVRRGDTATVRRHLEALRRAAPDLIPLYVAIARAQLPLARALGDASPNGLAGITRLLSGSRARAVKRGRATKPRSRRRR
jgi:predicted short-subunit dehydrogenase-like oxidoreductase (DUF2520 family)